MRSKLISLEEAVKLVSSGSSIAFGGSILRRQPMAFVHEMIRQGIKDLTVFGYPCGLATDTLAGVGAVKRVEGVYTGLFQFGMSYNFRRAVESGELDMKDYPEVAQAARFQAAAMNIDFIVTKDMLGTDMARYNPEDIVEVTSPFTGEKYHAVKAAKTDFTVLHEYVADEYGNVQWPDHRDADDLDMLFAKGSRRLIVTVEKIVPHNQITCQPNKTFIPHNWVEAIVEVPFGTHPAPCDSFYDEDDEHMALYQSLAKDGRWREEYAKEYIYGVKNHWEYLNKALTPERMAKLIVR
ncbi:MAG: CoA transferase subunit A [Acidithiobacillus sp.]